METTIPYIRHTDVLDNLTDSESGNGSIDVTQTTKEGGGELIYSRYLLKQGNNLFFYMSPVLLISGNVGNFISIVIMCSAYFRKSPFSLMMIVLALMDTGNLNTGLLSLWLDMKYDISLSTLTTTAGCKIHLFAVYFFGCMCGWSIVLMTAERAVSVISPLRAREICSRKRMGIALVGVTASVFLSFLYLLIYVQMYSTVRYDEWGTNLLQIL